MTFVARLVADFPLIARDAQCNDRSKHEQHPGFRL
jgi:hypothetical protein